MLSALTKLESWRRYCGMLTDSVLQDWSTHCPCCWGCNLLMAYSGVTLQAFPSSKESHLPMFMPPSWEQPTYNERRIRGLGGYESLAPCLNSGQLWRLTPAPELPCGMGWGLSCKFVTCQLLLLSHLASLTPLERLFPRAVPSKPPTGKSHHSVCFPEALPQHTFWHELNHRYSK